MKRLQFLLLLLLISFGVYAQTTPWTGTPVTTQTRSFSGAKQIRWLWGSNSLYALDDSLARYRYNFLNGLTKDGSNNVLLGGNLINHTGLNLNGYNLQIAGTTGTYFSLQDNGQFSFVAQDIPTPGYTAGYAYGNIGSLALGARSPSNEVSLNFNVLTNGTVFNDDLSRGIKYSWTDDSFLGDSSLVPKRYVTSAISSAITAATPTASGGIVKSGNDFRLGSGTLQGTTLIDAASNIFLIGDYTGQTGIIAYQPGAGAQIAGIGGGWNAGFQANSGNLNIFNQQTSTGISNNFVMQGGNITITDAKNHKGIVNDNSITHSAYNSKTLVDKSYTDSTSKAKADSISRQITNTYVSATTAVSGINVFGTSYEGPGFGSTNPSTLAWVPQVKNATGWVVNNQAVSSAFVLDQTRFIYNTPIVSRTLSIYDLEINDMNFYYTDADKQAIFANEHLATVAYLAIPDSKKILANSSAVTYTGTWTAGKYAISKQTSGNGNTATFTISGTTVMVSTTVGDGLTGAFTIKIDGSTVGTYTNGTVASMATNNGSGITFGPSIKMFTGLSNTAHTVVITTTNANAVFFDWAAGVDTSTPNPSVFVTNTIYQNATGNPYPINNANVDLYNSFVTNNISTLTGLGLNVTLIDVNSVINPATDVTGFGLHPNDAGYAKIATKVLATIPSTFYNVGSATQTQSSANNVAAWTVLKNTNPGTRAGVGIRLENDDSSNGAIFRASSVFTDGTPYGLYISNNSVSNNTVLTNDIIFNNGAVEALRLLSGNVRMPQFKTAGVITNAATTGQLSSNPTLSSTLGGSGVSNAGNLTWGSGGTLGSMAFISTASPTFTGTMTVPTGSFSGTQVGMFTAWPVNTLALFGASASGGTGYPFTGNNNALIAARPSFDIVFGTGNPTVTRGYVSALSGNFNWGSTSGTDLGALFSVTQPTTGNGTVSNSASGTTVTGVGTQFTNTFKIGDVITIAGETQTITAIASNTSMTTAAWTNAHTTSAYTLVGGTRFQVKGNGNIQATLPAYSSGTALPVSYNSTNSRFETGFVNRAHTIFTPTTGGTVVLVNNQYNIINPAGTLVALTVTLPSSPANNDIVQIKYTQSVTTVTYNGGTVVDGITSPVAGGYVILTYDSTNNSWY
jgi:hypothetical protein